MSRITLLIATIGASCALPLGSAHAQPGETELTPIGSDEGFASGPKELDYEEGQPIAPGYHVETRARIGLVASGAVLFGLGYVSAVVVGAVGSAWGGFGSGSNEEKPNWTPMFYPLVGPFIAVDTSNTGVAGAVPLIVNGVAQVGGLALFIAGLAAPKSVLVRTETVSVRFAPVVGNDGSAGIWTAGSF